MRLFGSLNREKEDKNVRLYCRLSPEEPKTPGQMPLLPSSRPRKKKGSKCRLRLEKVARTNLSSGVPIPKRRLQRAISLPDARGTGATSRDASPVDLSRVLHIAYPCLHGAVDGRVRFPGRTSNATQQKRCKGRSVSDKNDFIPTCGALWTRSDAPPQPPAPLSAPCL